MPLPAIPRIRSSTTSEDAITLLYAHCVLLRGVRGRHNGLQLHLWVQSSSYAEGCVRRTEDTHTLFDPRKKKRMCTNRCQLDHRNGHEYSIHEKGKIPVCGSLCSSPYTRTETVVTVVSSRGRMPSSSFATENWLKRLDGCSQWR